ncbi:FadR/GntR family transcriptional regulator [Streptomyces thermocarboxydus]
MSAVDKAFHGLRHMIATGRLGAGERIPPEADLCEELGVSRGSLREAVRMLAALGVIEPRHGSGTYVSQLRPEDLIGSLS